MNKKFKNVTFIGIVLFTFGVSCDIPVKLEQNDIQLITSYNKTAINLYRSIAENKKNVLISPFSIGTAMSMVVSGARGDTEHDLMTALNHTLTRDKIELSNQKINGYIKQLNNNDTILSMANALCVTSSVKQKYKELLIEKYNAEVFKGDLKSINSWVNGKTNGKIDKILETLNPNSVCVLLNAIYFKSFWDSKFDVSNTKSEKFHITKNKNILVDMMTQSSEYAVIKKKLYKAISMPYKNKLLSFVIVLPNNDINIALIEKNLDHKTVTEIIDELKITTTEKTLLKLPKFKIEIGTDLIPEFKKLGMKLPFEFTKGGFSGITDTNLKISQIQHKAFLEINEVGSEAAAVTAVVCTKECIAKPNIFKVDKPFIFLLVEKTSNAILFIGRVNNPLESN